MLRPLFLLAALAVASDGPSFADALSRQGLRYAGARSYRGARERSWGAAGSRRLAAASADARLKASSEPDADAAAARRRLGEWAARFLGQFAGDAAYPGMVTREVAVPDSLRPRRVEADGRTVWLAPASAGMAFGVGAEDLVAYRAVVSQRWCPGSRRSVELALFFSTASYREADALAEEASFTCLGAAPRPAP
ncbi:MAG: hypothetical protein SF051_08115 [Elusimicrobiota bacterium]|nr:hypothetical protein [Elusimicrobiota bacterium]